MLNPSLLHWEVTNWSMFVFVCVGERQSETDHMCANATNPIGISVIFEGFQAALGSCMHAGLCLLSCTPHAELNTVAREWCRKQIP